jgi:hypothetical protein
MSLLLLLQQQPYAFASPSSTQYSSSPRNLNKSLICAGASYLATHW